MNEKTIATISLPDTSFPNLEAILSHAAHWVKIAAAQGAGLAVLPETINLLHRDAKTSALEEFALRDWRTETALLCETAARHRISLALPLLVSDGQSLSNRFYLLARDGSELGFYQKRVPAIGERISGVEPATTQPLQWEGLKVGGSICIDIYFPHQVIEPQIQAGAELILAPSMTPAGAFLETCAVSCGVPFVLAYSPWSRILDRDGRELAAGGYRSETLRAGYGEPLQQAIINFNAVSLFADFNQQKLTDVQKHYGVKVRVRFDQHNCIFLLESRSPDLSIHEVMREFGLVSRRDYFAHLGPESSARQPMKVETYQG